MYPYSEEIKRYEYKAKFCEILIYRYLQQRKNIGIYVGVYDNGSSEFSYQKMHQISATLQHK